MLDHTATPGQYQLTGTIATMTFGISWLLTGRSVPMMNDRTPADTTLGAPG